MSAFAWIAFVIAGAVGAPARYLIDGLVTNRTKRAFPWGTLIVNASGSLLLGVLTGLALYHGFPNTQRVVLGTGFCGAYTTFSTFSFDTVHLVKEAAAREAIGNVVLTVLTCATASALGLVLAAI